MEATPGGLFSLVTAARFRIVSLRPTRADASVHAGVTQLVECNLAKVDVASSSLVTRSLSQLQGDTNSRLIFWVGLRYLEEPLHAERSISAGSRVALEREDADVFVDAFLAKLWHRVPLKPKRGGRGEQGPFSGLNRNQLYELFGELDEAVSQSGRTAASLRKMRVPALDFTAAAQPSNISTSVPRAGLQPNINIMASVYRDLKRSRSWIACFRGPDGRLGELKDLLFSQFDLVKNVLVYTPKKQRRTTGTGEYHHSMTSGG